MAIAKNCYICEVILWRPRVPQKIVTCPKRGTHPIGWNHWSSPTLQFYFMLNILWLILVSYILDRYQFLHSVDTSVVTHCFHAPRVPHDSTVGFYPVVGVLYWFTVDGRWLCTYDDVPHMWYVFIMCKNRYFILSCLFFSSNLCGRSGEEFTKIGIVTGVCRNKYPMVYDFQGMSVDLTKWGGLVRSFVNVSVFLGLSY